MEAAGWGALALAFVAAIILIWAPGTLVGVSLRLRGLWLVATAPLFGVTSISLASLWSGALGIPWTAWTVAITAIALAAIGTVLWAAIPAARTPTERAQGWRWASVIAGGSAFILLGYRFIAAIGAPDWFVQQGDNVFHLNAVRWILDNGNASSFTVMNGLDPSAGTLFYPVGWHAIVALVCQITSASIPIASNAVLICVGGVIWPLGAVLLTRALFGSETPLLVAAGVISAGFATYPLMLIPYMGTYPLVMSIALITPTLVAAAAALRVAYAAIPRPVATLVVLLALPGIGIAHPSALVMLAALALPLVITALVRLARERKDRRRLAGLLTVLSAAVVLALIVLVRPGFEQPDAPRSSTGQALGEVLSGGFVATPIPVVLSGLMIVGLVVAIRRGGIRDWAAVGMWLVAASIYIATVSNDEFMHLLVGGPWFSDATRIAAFTPAVILPLAANGAAATWRWIASKVDFSAHPVRRRASEITAIALMGLIMVQSTAAQSMTGFMSTMFTPTTNLLTSPLAVSADDRILLSRVPSLVPAGAVIAGDPWTGASFAYALTGRRVLVPHMLAPVTGQTKVLFDGIATSAPDGPACRAARELGVGWILELHGGKTLPNRPKYAGLEHLAQSPNLKLVSRVGDSSLYRIAGCRKG